MDATETPKSIACIFCPQNWSIMVQENPFIAFGALVFVASQARDYYNNHLDVHTKERSYAFESEYLHAAMHRQSFVLNDYQKKVMTDYPNGLISLAPSLCYESKAFEEK